MSTYKLIWDDYCSWFLEMVKPEYGAPIDSATYKAVIGILEDNLKILHPFMPFVTEEIWQEITERTPEQALIIAKWPEEREFDEKLIKEFAHASEVIAGVRKIRKEKNISFKNEIELSVLNNEEASKTFDAVIAKMGKISSLDYVDGSVEGALSFRVKSNEYFIPIGGAIDVEAEKKKIQEELNYTEGFLKSVEKKLSNERFVNNAPEKVVDVEKAKKADAEAKIEALKASLKNLN